MSSPWGKYLKLFLLVLREKKLPISPTFAAVGEGDEARVEKGNQKHIIQPGMAFIEHLLWVVIMCGAIRNTDYRTAVYSPKTSVSQPAFLLTGVLPLLCLASQIPLQRLWFMLYSLPLSPSFPFNVTNHTESSNRHFHLHAHSSPQRDRFPHLNSEDDCGA